MFLTIQKSTVDDSTNNTNIFDNIQFSMIKQMITGALLVFTTGLDVLKHLDYHFRTSHCCQTSPPLNCMKKCGC